MCYTMDHVKMVCDFVLSKPPENEVLFPNIVKLMNSPEYQLYIKRIIWLLMCGKQDDC